MTKEVKDSLHRRSAVSFCYLTLLSNDWARLLINHEIDSKNDQEVDKIHELLIKAYDAVADLNFAILGEERPTEH